MKRDNSLFLTKLLINTVIVLIPIIAIFSSKIIYLFLEVNKLLTIELYLNISFYLSLAVAFIILIELKTLIKNIENDNIFEVCNIKILKRISYYFFIEAMIAFVSSFYLLSWALIMLASFFMALIIRVLKNVFRKAYLIKLENDYTV